MIEENNLIIGNWAKQYICILFIFFSGTAPLFAQTTSDEILHKKLSYRCSQKTTASILLELSQQAQVGIGFGTAVLDSELRSYDFKEETLTFILNEVLAAHDLDFIFTNNGILLKGRASLQEFIISGFLEDSNTGEALISGTVYQNTSGRGAITNEFGFFSLKVKAGQVNLEASYLGYEKILKKFDLTKDETVRFAMKPSLSFEPIEVRDSSSSLSNQQFSFSNSLQMNLKTLQTVPSLGGESDLFRYLQHQPGITTGADGLGGLHVRGGNVDQNLIMLDGIPIFNPSHALGLFSIFNTSIVNSASLYRSGFSARYGGHLSSVLDVRTKEGNLKKFSATLDLSTVATKALVEVPFRNEKGGFLFALRRTHLDPIILRQSSNIKYRSDLLGDSNFNFYDINTKVNFKAGIRDRFYFSFYRGADAYQDLTVWDFSIILDEISSQDYAQEQQYINWSNTIGSFRWNHIYGDQLFSNVTATISRFNYQNFNTYLSDLSVDGSLESFDFYNRFFSNIIDIRLKVDFDYYLNSNHKLIWGGEVLHRSFEPGSLGGDSRLLIDPDEEFDFATIIPDTFSSTIIPTTEASIYFEDQLKIGPDVSVNFGLRNTIFQGPDRIYNSIQPRLNIVYQPNKKINIDFGASRMSQFLHLVTASDAGLPNDLWVPSTASVLPQHAWETSLSFGHELFDGFKYSIAGYYKHLVNTLAYAPDASLPTLKDNDPDFWEEQVEQGDGLTYGIESQFQYSFSRQILNVNYTWANSNRFIDNLNDGKIFPSRYDLRHVLQLNYSNQFSPQWELQLSWRYSSGQPISLITVANEFSPLSTPNALEAELASGINGYRLPDYHRLDGNLKWISKNIKHQITIGAYNIYNQHNPLFAYQVASEIDAEDNGIRTQPGLGIIPTIGYQWKIR